LGEQHPIVRPATINRELATLSHLLHKALEWGWIDRFAGRIWKLKEGTGRIVYLAAEQANALHMGRVENPSSKMESKS
jgi:hypothetical protein